MNTARHAHASAGMAPGDTVMKLRREEIRILIVNIIYISIFSSIAYRRENYEFVLYAVVVGVVATIIVLQQARLRLDRTLLWGLTIWGLLHMAGGIVRIDGRVLYAQVLLPLFPKFEVIRYDHAVHMFGFGILTLVSYHLLRPFLRNEIDRWWTIWLLVVLMGSGFGALNEIIEFIAVITVPETGVGGYQNTLLDLVFNLVGGIAAAGWLAFRQRREMGRERHFV